MHCVSFGRHAGGWREQLPLEEVIKRPVSFWGENRAADSSAESGGGGGGGGLN